jgi:hypothetical protein
MELEDPLWYSREPAKKPILSHMNSIHTSRRLFLRCVLILISYPGLSLPPDSCLAFSLCTIAARKSPKSLSYNICHTEKQAYPRTFRLRGTVGIRAVLEKVMTRIPQYLYRVTNTSHPVCSHSLYWCIY